MECYVLSVIMLVILINCSFWSIGHDCASNVRVLLVTVYFLCELGFLVRCCRRLRYIGLGVLLVLVYFLRELGFYVRHWRRLRPNR